MTVSGSPGLASSAVLCDTKLSIRLRLQAMGLTDQLDHVQRRDLVGSRRSWCDDIARLRSLPPPGIIVLFTPVLIPHGFDNSEGDVRIDPFEKLGRELSRYHARICHVPYLTEVGLTETHVDWIRRAAAIITVTCARGAESGRRGEYQAKLLATQMKLFAHEIATSASEALELTSKIPLVGLAFTNAFDSFSEDYGTVLKTDRYDYPRAELIAQSLFTGNV